MAVAGHTAVFAVATGASATYSSVDGISSVSLDDGTDMLDITDLADSNIRRRIAGLRDLSISLSGDVELADTGYGMLRACYNAGSIVYARFLADGTNGVMIPCLVESRNIEGSVEDKVTVSIQLQSEGSISPVTVFAGM